MKEQILKLRAEGKTFNEIKNTLGCSKSTISYYCSEGQKEKNLQRTKKKRAGLAGEPLKLITDTCIRCGTKVKKNAKKFCSHSCQRLDEKEGIIERWLKREEVGHSGKLNALRSTIRDYILEKANYTCSICGWNKRHPVDGKPLVEIDHIDGNSLNSFEDNLRVLCPNCHSETPTFRARNKVSQRDRNKTGKPKTE